MRSAAPTRRVWFRAAEGLFDRLNPSFGVPADHTDPAGHQAAQTREAGLLLGTRAAVALLRENDPNPLLLVVGQDDRVAAAVRPARKPPTLTAIAHEQAGG